MIELLAVIEAPHFTAGIVLRNDRVVEAADIVGYMKRNKWTRDQVRAYCERRGWAISVISQSKISDRPFRRSDSPPSS